MSKLLLIDSHAVIHRAFHSIPKQLAYQGKPVNAMYGFYSMLYVALDKLNPKYIKWLEDRVFKTIGKDIINSDEYTYLLRCEKELNGVSE